MMDKHFDDRTMALSLRSVRGKLDFLHCIDGNERERLEDARLLLDRLIRELEK